MYYSYIPGLEKPVSRLILGVDHQVIWAQAAMLFDDFFAQGGNCFDTAFKYKEGRCEEVLGQWIQKRQVREQVVVVGKGAHTPYCTPAWIEKQLKISLERLQTDYVDIYLLHRDNPDIPVEDFILALHEQQKAGRIHVYGASNWSIERIEHANQWARTHGISGFVTVSNHLSLAHMLRPAWTGCISMTDRRSRAWLRSTGLPLMSWSSQARGFFSGTHDWAAEDPQSPLMRGWYSQGNLQRLKRAQQLARIRHTFPNTVALAYVLCQPFRTFPIIGPRSVDQYHYSLQALDLHLSEEELRWLNLESNTCSAYS